jgi:hypothetical protein
MTKLLTHHIQASANDKASLTFQIWNYLEHVLLISHIWLMKRPIFYFLNDVI